MKYLIALMLTVLHCAAATLNVPGTYATVQLAVNAAQPGDTVFIAPGIYDETVTTARDGTSVNRITIDGGDRESTQIKRLLINNSYMTIKNLKIKGANGTWSNTVFFNLGANYNILQDCIVDSEEFFKCAGISFSGSATNPDSEASYNIIERCWVRNIFAYPMLSIGGRQNIIRNNLIKDGYSVDFIRCMGVENHVHDNIFQNNTVRAGSEFHPDFTQTFGNNGERSYGHIFERNRVDNIVGGQIFQFSATGQPDIRDWTFRNNIFSNCTLGGGGNAPGMKFYNNIFYKIGSSISFSLRTFGYNTGITSTYPIYNEMTQATPSGSLVAEGDGGQYRYGGYYQVRAPEVLLGTALIPGKVYIARTRGSGKIVYNGVEYLNQQTFTCLPGITTWTETYTNIADAAPTQLFFYAQLTYKGVTYNREAWFQCQPDTRTYTVNQPEAGPWRVVIDFAHRTEVVNNVFLDCGAPGAWQAFYGFDLNLQNVRADYNMVTKDGFQPVLVRAGSIPIGDPRGWGGKGWYEPNGINGGDPGFVDFSNLDFRIGATSPLVDQGDTLLGVTSDFANTPRPLGLAPDIGAYEYDDGSPPPVITPGSPPVAPTALTANATSSTSVTIGWTDNATNESVYEIERSLNNSTWTKTNTLAANSTTFIVTGLSPSTLYYWRVRAINGDGNSAYTNVVSATTQAPPVINLPPAAPDNFGALAIGAHSISMGWDDNSADETGFEVASSQDGVSWVTATTTAANVTSWVQSGLSPLTTYYYRVRAINAAGPSAWSAVDAETTAPTPPDKPARARVRQLNGGIP